MHCNHNTCWTYICTACRCSSAPGHSSSREENLTYWYNLQYNAPYTTRPQQLWLNVCLKGIHSTNDRRSKSLKPAPSWFLSHCSWTSLSGFYLFFFPAQIKNKALTQAKTLHVSSLRHTWVRWLGKSNVNHCSLPCRIYPVSPLPPSLLDSEGPALLNYSSHWGEDRSMHGFSTPCFFPFSLCL